MQDLNRVALVGRLTRNAELIQTGTGLAVSKFSIAVNRSRKNGDHWEDEVNYFDLVSFGRQAESLNQHLVKGKQVAIDGELKQERWQQDGQNRSKVEVVVNHIQLLGDRKSEGNGGYNNGVNW
jgi:single-strand DNA-binding protein